MAYVGTPLDTTNAFQSLAGKRFNGDGSTTDFTLDSSPNSTLDIEVFVGNVRQDPNSAYTVSGTTLGFTAAPPSGTNNIYVVHQAKAVGTIDPAVGSTLDLNGAAELVLDADADTTITADTDDQIDIKIAGADDFQFTANTFTAQSGSTITTPTLGVGDTKDLGSGLHIKTADSGVSSVDSAADELIIEGVEDSGLSIITPNDHFAIIRFGDPDDNDVGAIEYSHSSNFMRFYANAAERMRILSDGNVVVGKTSATFGTAGHSFYGVSGDVGKTEITSEAGTTPLLCNRLDDGNILALFSAGSVEGTIAISGTTTAYNTFCGAHWSRLADNSKPTILRGTVIESIATMMDWYLAVADVAESTDSDGNVTPAHQIKESIALPNGKSVGDAVTFTSRGKEYTGKYVKEDNEQLPMCKISDTADSKAVYGVFMDWDDGDDGLDNDVNDMHVASLGAFVVRVHKDQTVAIGNWLVSNGDGTAKVLAGNTTITADVQSSIIGKVTSTEKTHIHGDGSYCVPCTLHCG